MQTRPTPYQLQVLLEHVAAPVPFVARGARPVSIRALVSDGLLSFDQRRLETRITQAGRDKLTVYFGTLQAAE